MIVKSVPVQSGRTKSMAMVLMIVINVANTAYNPPKLIMGLFHPMESGIGEMQQMNANKQHIGKNSFTAPPSKSPTCYKSSR